MCLFAPVVGVRAYMGNINKHGVGIVFEDNTKPYACWGIETASQTWFAGRMPLYDLCADNIPLTDDVSHRKIVQSPTAGLEPTTIRLRALRSAD